MQGDLRFDVYLFSKKEKVLYGLLGIAGMYIFAELFYGTYWAMIVFVPFYMLLLKHRKKELLKKQKSIFVSQFRDFLLSLSTSLIAGYSIENAMKQAQKEMEKLHGKNSYIGIEIMKMNHDINLSVPVVEVFLECGKRTGIEEVLLFSEIYGIASSSGSNLIDTVKQTASRLGEKIEVKRELVTLISGKKLEHRILCLLPVLLGGYMNITSPGYFSCMYGTLAGIGIMSVCFVVYFLAWILGERLVSIEV